jgi:hypothetical protein
MCNSRSQLHLALFPEDWWTEGRNVQLKKPAPPEDWWPLQLDLNKFARGQGTDLNSSSELVGGG